MTSSILPPRSKRGDCSPSTQRTASEMFDLPHPLGPTIAVTPASNGNSTVLAKDLKPDSYSRVSLMVWSPSVSQGWPECGRRSEEHTSELQSQSNLVCRLLLEKKKKTTM